MKPKEKPWWRQNKEHSPARRTRDGIRNDFGDQRPTNEAEGACWDLLTTLGWRITRRGWPDFVGLRDGHMIAIEVKGTRGRRLKEMQRLVMQALARCGVECYRFSPDEGFSQLYINPKRLTGYVTLASNGLSHDERTTQKLPRRKH